MTNQIDKAPFIMCNASPAMSGHFASLYTFDDECGFHTPWTSGFGRYATLDEAEEEGRRWAQDEGVKFVPVNREASAKMKKVWDDRLVLIKQLKAEQGLGFVEAMRIAREKYPG
jgi:hypothetical protein